MNKFNIVVAIILLFSAKTFAVDMDFDQGMDINTIITKVNSNSEKAISPIQEQLNESINELNSYNENHYSYQNNHSGHNNNHSSWYNDNHNNYPDDGHHYYESYTDMDCVTWEFTSQTPNTRTETLYGETRVCPISNGLQQYCRDTGDIYSREVTVNIGQRKLEAWETESLKVCLESQDSAKVDIEKMSYEYTVTSKNRDSFWGKHSTEFTLTPGKKKLTKPSFEDLELGSIKTMSNGSVVIILKDMRAEYFKGEKIDISLSGMHIVEFDDDKTSESNSDQSRIFINASKTFDVSPYYEMKILDKDVKGKYMVIVKFSRKGPLSSDEEETKVIPFELK